MIKHSEKNKTKSLKFQICIFIILNAFKFKANHKWIHIWFKILIFYAPIFVAIARSIHKSYNFLK